MTFRKKVGAGGIDLRVIDTQVMAESNSKVLSSEENVHLSEKKSRLREHPGMLQNLGADAGRVTHREAGEEPV